MQDRPDDLAEAFSDARSNGPRWVERMDKSLSQMPATRRRLHSLT